MLKSWSIENFKAIVNSGDLKLAPVTILAGKNSSGKSSLLQSILMIAQTLSNQNSDLALLTNGDLAKLRTFEDILSNYTQSSNIKIKFELDDKDKDPKLRTQEISSQAVTVTFSSASENKISSSAIEASKVVVDNVVIHYYLEIEGFYSQQQFWEARIKQFDKTNFEFTVRRAKEDKSVRNLENAAVIRTRQSNSYKGKTTWYPEELSINLFHFLPSKFVTKFDDDNYDLIYTLMLAHLAEGNLRIIDFFTRQIRYLGPFRAKPDITAQGFSTKGSIDDVGIEGEYAASVYHANQNATVDWYNPHSKQVEQGTLKVALDTWVQYLGIAHQVITEEAGLVGVMWKVVLMPDQKAHTLSEVGVGLSQILPILIMGLLSPKDSLLIMEQPELHLHSKVQARLGDFFVGISKCRKQCIIETHSENIVSELRYHIVEAGGQEKSDCIIYFVDQDEKGAAKFEPVEISPNGNILNWPDGFFDETMHQENRINAASIRRRARLKKNG